jgi:hypothetical protein
MGAYPVSRQPSPRPAEKYDYLQSLIQLPVGVSIPEYDGVHI